MKEKIKVSLSRNFGTENIAMTAEILKDEIPEFQKFFRDTVHSQYESVMLTAIPESEISAKYAVERAEALKKQSDALKQLQDEASKLANEESRSARLLKKNGR